MNDCSFIKDILIYLGYKLLINHSFKTRKNLFRLVSKVPDFQFSTINIKTKIDTNNMTRHPKSSTKPKSKSFQISKGIVEKSKPISHFRKTTGKGIPIFWKLAECDQFDIIGTLITEKSLTGENLTRQIFSHLDLSSLFRVQMVSKTWRLVNICFS